MLFFPLFVYLFNIVIIDVDRAINLTEMMNIKLA